MRFETVEVQNFKAFKQHTFRFHPSLNIIIGDNGTGKTSLLDGLSLGIQAYIDLLQAKKQEGICEEHVRFQWDGSALVHHYPSSLTYTGTKEDCPFEWQMSKENETTQRVYVNVENNEIEELPLFSYQHVHRQYHTEKDRWISFFKRRKQSRFDGYNDCLTGSFNSASFYEWMKRVYTKKRKYKHEKQQLEAILMAVGSFMSDIIFEDEVSITYSEEFHDLAVQIDTNYFPLKLLNSGYQTMIMMIAELTYRATLLNPHLNGKDVTNVHGIVLIDELDLHLNPKWHEKSLGNLQKLFPNVQFIITTHSPRMAEMCEASQIINVEQLEMNAISQWFK